MTSRTATGLTLVLAAATLVVPRWLYGGAEAGAHSALRFEVLSHDFGEVLEGEEVVFDFPYQNTLDTPLRIERARHCGCIHLERPRDAIAPGESGVLRMRLDSRNRTGRQVKPIDLITDETDGGEAKLVVTGFVRSPLILRQNRLLVQGAMPGQVTEHAVAVIANDDVGLVQGGTEDGEFIEVDLREDGDGRWVLDVRVQAPEEFGSANGTVTLTCETGGRTWTKSIPVRVVVPRPFRTLPPTRLTLREGTANLTVMTDDPARARVTAFEGTVPGLEVSESRRNDRMLTLVVSLAGGVTALPADAAVRITTDHPTMSEILVPVVVADG